MTVWGDRIGRCGRGLVLLPAVLLAVALVLAVPTAVSAQWFGERPPPVPPAAVPDTGPAINLAPPSGPGATPTLPAPLPQPTIMQPSTAAPPPAAPSPGAPTAGQAVLSLTARYGKDLPAINNGLVWRGVFGEAGHNGDFTVLP